MFEQNLTSEALTVTTVTSQDQITQKPLRDSVKASLKKLPCSTKWPGSNRTIRISSS